MGTVPAPCYDFFALKNDFMAVCMFGDFDHVQAEGESAHWEALESFRVDVQAKFDEFSATARVTNKTVEELLSMMVQFMRRDKRLQHPGPSTTELANVTGTTEELTLSDLEHAIPQTLAPSLEFQVVQHLDVPVSNLPGDRDHHIPYNLDAAWASRTTKDHGGNDEAPTAATVMPAGENEGTAGGQAADPIPT